MYLAKGVGLLEGFDLVQVAIDQPIDQYRFRQVLRARSRHDDTERDRFKFGLLSALNFERLGDCRSRGSVGDVSLFRETR